MFEDFDFDSDNFSQKSQHDSERFKILTSSEVVELMNKEISQVKNIIDLPDNQIRVLLDKYKWDTTVCLEKFFEENSSEIQHAPTKIIEKPKTITKQEKKIEEKETRITRSKARKRNSQVVFQELNSQIKTRRSNKSVKIFEAPKADHLECNICLDSIKVDAAHKWKCGHQVCKSCFVTFLETTIGSTPNMTALQCPGYNCNVLLDDQVIISVLDESWVSKYKQVITNGYVLSKRMICWCPGKDCSNAIEMKDLTNQPAVRCSCGMLFCFKCSNDIHNLIPCKMAVLFNKDKDQHLSTGVWLAKNCKQCPKCFVEIEKNGGCNHMTCRKCHFEFCWICGASWMKHTYCHNIESKTFLESKSRRIFENANKHSTMMQSIKLDENLYKSKIEAQEREAIKSAFYKIDFFKDAVETLKSCRHALADTFIFKYFNEDPKNSHWLCFAMNQNSLQKAIEDLSHIMENQINGDNFHEMKPKIQYAAKYCDSLLKALKDQIQEGIQKDFSNEI